MTVTDWRRKRRILSLVVLFCTLAAFAVNVFDVREDLELLSCPDNGMDHNVMACVMNSVAVEPVLLRTLCSVQPDASVEVASVDRSSNDFRAPPSLS